MVSGVIGDVVFAALIVVAVANWIPPRARETSGYVLAVIYVIFFVAYWYDVRREKNELNQKMVSYQTEMTSYESLRSEVEAANRELERLQERVAEHDRRQRGSARSRT